jgi:hypothetical protein
MLYLMFRYMYLQGNIVLFLPERKENTYRYSNKYLVYIVADQVDIEYR